MNSEINTIEMNEERRYKIGSMMVFQCVYELYTTNTCLEL